MLPLAMVLKASGANVSGSDRALDQGRTPEKFDWLSGQGIDLFPQDGSGLVSGEQLLVASAAIEDTVPDIAAALAQGCTRMTRAELLSSLFNDAAFSIGVAGTSGKSTTTAMIAWILQADVVSPTVVNGAVMSNFASPEAPYASAVAGSDQSLVAEVDESDGSIALYQPSVAVVTNITKDHKTMEELRVLFGDFVSRSSQLAVLNADDAETVALAPLAGRVRTFSLSGGGADLVASDIEPGPTFITFRVTDSATQKRVGVRLPVPGRHNVSNALAAMAATLDKVGLELAAQQLASFAGTKRRFEIVGEAGGVTVIDDFGHNPDKIAATVQTLHDFPGRVLALFQPHGFGPLRLMKTEFIETFTAHLAPEDLLVVPEPVYFGGTVTRDVSSEDIAAGIRASGRQALAFANREEAGAYLVSQAVPGDRLIVMGARDDSLSAFASNLLLQLRNRAD